MLYLTFTALEIFTFAPVINHRKTMVKFKRQKTMKVALNTFLARETLQHQPIKIIRGQINKKSYFHLYYSIA
ncbi:hypothetical protein CXF78_08830 [Shewanella sp. 11B5]|nr:hypothetical protein CXF78_08830 [Shewanella sp. 11B5]